MPSSTATTRSDRIKRLGMKVPADVYTPSPRPYRGLEELDYPLARLDRDDHAVRPHLLATAARSTSVWSSPDRTSASGK